MKNVRVLIADDNPQILRFISNLLSDTFCIVGTVSDRRALIAAALGLQPHIIIIDMPTRAGLDAVRQLEALMPDITLMVLTDHEEPEFAAAALSAGTSVFLIENGRGDLCGKIRAIIQDLFTAHPEWFTERAPAYGNNHASIERGVA